MLSPEMKRLEHLELIDEKISKFIRIFNLLKFMNKNLKLKQKKILYKQVCIPTIAYAAKVWLPDLKYDYQFKALKRIQTGFYCRTPLKDKLNLTGILEIESELKTLNPNKDERRAEQDRLLRQQDYDKQFAALDDCRSREVIWFYVGQVPSAVTWERWGWPRLSVVGLATLTSRHPNI